MWFFIIVVGIVGVWELLRLATAMCGNGEAFASFRGAFFVCRWPLFLMFLDDGNSFLAGWLFAVYLLALVFFLAAV